MFTSQVIALFFFFVIIQDYQKWEPKPIPLVWIIHRGWIKVAALKKIYTCLIWGGFNGIIDRASCEHEFHSTLAKNVAQNWSDYNLYRDITEIHPLFHFFLLNNAGRSEKKSEQVKRDNKTINELLYLTEIL